MKHLLHTRKELPIPQGILLMMLTFTAIVVATTRGVWQAQMTGQSSALIMDDQILPADHLRTYLSPCTRESVGYRGSAIACRDQANHYIHMTMQNVPAGTYDVYATWPIITGAGNSNTTVAFYADLQSGERVQNILEMMPGGISQPPVLSYSTLTEPSGDTVDGVRWLKIGAVSIASTADVKAYLYTKKILVDAFRLVPRPGTTAPHLPPVYTNPTNRFDVDHDGTVTLEDANRVTEHVAKNGAHAAVESDAEVTTHLFLDVNADGWISLLDATLVRTEINATNTARPTTCSAKLFTFFDTASPWGAVTEPEGRKAITDLINLLNANGVMDVRQAAKRSYEHLDLSGDGRLSSVDVLTAINAMNSGCVSPVTSTPRSSVSSAASSAAPVNPPSLQGNSMVFASVNIQTKAIRRNDARGNPIDEQVVIDPTVKLFTTINDDVARDVRSVTFTVLNASGTPVFSTVATKAPWVNATEYIAYWTTTNVPRGSYKLIAYAKTSQGEYSTSEKGLGLVGPREFAFDPSLGRSGDPALQYVIRKGNTPQRFPLLEALVRHIDPKKTYILDTCLTVGESPLCNQKKVDGRLTYEQDWSTVQYTTSIAANPAWPTSLFCPDAQGGTVKPGTYRVDVRLYAPGRLTPFDTLVDERTLTITVEGDPKNFGKCAIPSWMEGKTRYLLDDSDTTFTTTAAMSVTNPFARGGSFRKISRVESARWTMSLPAGTYEILYDRPVRGTNRDLTLTVMDQTSGDSLKLFSWAEQPLQSSNPNFTIDALEPGAGGLYRIEGSVWHSLGRIRVAKNPTDVSLSFVQGTREGNGQTTGWTPIDSVLLVQVPDPVAPLTIPASPTIPAPTTTPTRTTPGTTTPSTTVTPAATPSTSAQPSAQTLTFYWRWSGSTWSVRVGEGGTWSNLPTTPPRSLTPSTPSTANGVMHYATLSNGVWKWSSDGKTWKAW